VWPSQQACFESYRKKSLFANWPDRSLWAYVEAGTQARGDGQVELVYPPEWEAHIFATSPADVWQYVPRLRTPALVIRGEHTETFRPEAQERMERLLPEAEYRVIAGAGHLVPMERPEATGAVVEEFLNR
jgi:pimeloyl-ACP methyl ester carboxylesterase